MDTVEVEEDGLVADHELCHLELLLLELNDELGSHIHQIQFHFIALVLHFRVELPNRCEKAPNLHILLILGSLHFIHSRFHLPKF